MPTFSTGRIMDVAVAGLVIAALAGCDGGTEAEDETVEAAASGVAGGSSCVADYADSPCELLTADLVRQVLPGVPAEIEQESHSGSMFSSCSYSWPSDRVATREVAGRTIEYPEHNSVGLSWIETYESGDPQARFRREYLPTEEEMRRGLDRMEEEFDEQAEERGLDESQREIGRDLGRSVASSMSFEPVDGVGDRASWTANHNDLHVLVGDIKFQVSATVSSDESENRQTAIGLAEALMAACE